MCVRGESVSRRWHHTHKQKRSLAHKHTHSLARARRSCSKHKLLYVCICVDIIDFMLALLLLLLATRGWLAGGGFDAAAVPRAVPVLFLAWSVQPRASCVCAWCRPCTNRASYRVLVFFFMCV